MKILLTPQQKQQTFVKYFQVLKLSYEPVSCTDSVHSAQSTKLIYGCISKGQDKLIETTGNHTRLNIICALSLKYIASTVTKNYDTIRNEIIVRFFWKHKKQHYSFGEKVNSILVGASYHRTELVIDAEKLNFKLHYLPIYSPNLNTIGLLWKVTNEHVRNHVYFSSKMKFLSTVKEFSGETLLEIVGLLTFRIADNFRLLKTVSSS